MRRSLGLAVAGLSLLMLAACGGGGGGASLAPIPAGDGVTSPDDGQFHIDRKDAFVFVQEQGQPAPAPVTVHMNYSLPHWSVSPDSSTTVWLATTEIPTNTPQVATMQIGLSDPFVKLLPQGHYKVGVEFQEFTNPDGRGNSIFHDMTLPAILIIPQQFGMQHSDLAIVQGQDGSLAPLRVPLQADGVHWAAKTDSAWLALTQTSGNGSAVLNLHVTDPTLTLGTHEATVTVTDLDYNIDEKMTITVHVEPRALVTRVHGIGLTSAPGTSVLSASVPVVDGAGLPSTWSAVSDKSWLVIDTPAGSSGSSLGFHANPAGLSAGLHYAELTLSPKTAGVTGTQHVRVGLYVSTTPEVATSITQQPGFGQSNYINACDPIRPYCYSVGGNGVAIYNLFSGQVDATIPVAGIAATISPDGRTLYVANDRIIPVDLDSMTVQPALPSAVVPQQIGFQPPTYSLVAGQIGGRAVLVTNQLLILDAATGQTLRDFSALVPAPRLDPPAVALSHDGRQIMVRSQDNALLYRMEVDSDGSFAVGTTETHQELTSSQGGATDATDLAFASDDASFLCKSDQIWRYSSAYLGVSSIITSNYASSYVQARDDDTVYLFMPPRVSPDTNLFTPATLEHRSADNLVLQTLLSDRSVFHAQLVLSADQHRLAMYAPVPGFYFDLP